MLELLKFRVMQCVRIGHTHKIKTVSDTVTKFITCAILNLNRLLMNFLDKIPTLRCSVPERVNKAIRETHIPKVLLGIYKVPSTESPKQIHETKDNTNGRMIPSTSLCYTFLRSFELGFWRRTCILL